MDENHTPSIFHGPQPKAPEECPEAMGFFFGVGLTELSLGAGSRIRLCVELASSVYGTSEDYRFQSGHLLLWWLQLGFCP
jgi:hypothetical protein